MDFVRFMFCLGVGLIGLCMVLMTMLESVFSEWDVTGDLDHFVRRRRNLLGYFIKIEDEDEVGRGHGHRLNAYGRPSRPEKHSAPQRETEPAERVEA
ncbi:MAG: hypothetical protein NTX64_16150 [Elusimicrobia bacterium]|nr:hypothetical protein [Elusimicrobiota bacterium]